ncbi:MAG: isochorismatase family protein [Lachnospiraceae bacterium]|jgi:hypothetical protein|nr:isochorismatase family protein [Lachnospiraceae bacterium]
MRILKEETQAVIVDIQERLMPAMNEREEFEKRALMLIRGLRLLEVPMMITQEYTKGLGRSIPEVYEAAGTEEYFDKHAFCSTREPHILQKLEERKAEGRKTVIVCGTEAHVCVLQTCIGLKEAGFDPVLVVDAIASRRESDKQAALWRAMQEGILLTTTESLLFELTVDSNNPKFREISRLVK